MITLSELLAKHEATEFFINNFDKALMEKCQDIIPSIEHIQDSQLYTPNFDPIDENHPWITFINEYSELGDTLINDLLTLLEMKLPELVLVKFNSNWADEIDIEGFYITSSNYHKIFIEKASKHIEENGMFFYSVGTNEDIEYHSVDDLLECYEVTTITHAEYKILDKLGITSLGFTGPSIEEFEQED